MQFHLSLFLLQLLVRRRSQNDPAISGNVSECSINTMILFFSLHIKFESPLVTLSKAVFCWEGSAGGAGCGVTMLKPAVTFGT